MKLRSLGNGQYAFFCPGCNGYHSVATTEPFSNGAKWSFNGDMDKPTFSPSVLAHSDYPEARCHSFIQDGFIQYLDDCYHNLKGQTVEIPEEI